MGVSIIHSCGGTPRSGAEVHSQGVDRPMGRQRRSDRAAAGGIKNAVPLLGGTAFFTTGKHNLSGRVRHAPADVRYASLHRSIRTAPHARAPRNYISLAELIFTPGPMVEAHTQERMYCPFAAEGLALTMAPIRALKFSVSFSAPKETLPMGQWMMLVLSRRYYTLPALISVTALATSGVTVPALGEGIRPLGPRILPRRPTTPIMSGEATTTS